ncbi:MAG: transcription elongation factor GreA [Clostridia bacterium]|jgi:transcription elongation factor GreA|nr:transcription elongation factor GreA [Clostridiaceae bacterium]
MLKKEVYLTPEGLRQLEEELEYLKSTKRREVAARIKHALSFGDISENSEYDEAKNEQALVEAKIAEIEDTLRYSQIIVDEDITTDAVSIGSIVKLLDLEFDEEVEYRIVGSTEANPSKNRISNESPVGKALMGKKVGETVEVMTPGGIVKFKILGIGK